MIKVDRIQLGVWRTRLELLLKYEELSEDMRIAQQCTINEIDHAIRVEQEEWDGIKDIKEAIKQGEVVTL